MDAKRLQDIRRLVEKQQKIDTGNLTYVGWPEDYPDHTKELKSEIPALLDYIDALRSDMAKIRGLALQLTALSYSPAAIAGSEIYNLAAQHADEPEV